MQQPDFELYQRRVAKFHKDYVPGKIKSEYCPELELPDTIIILINSIQSVNYTVEIPAKYSEYEYHEYPENRLQILGGGVEIDVRKNELTLDGFYEMQLGMYRLIFEYNTTFNNSENKLHISSSALYSLGYTFVGMFIGSAIVDEPSDSEGKQKSTADRRQAGELVTHVAGTRALAADVVSQIVARTDGVPLYVEELTKMVVETVLAPPIEGGPESADAARSPAIPATLQD